jgi:hypothetical protein
VAAERGEEAQEEVLQVAPALQALPGAAEARREAARQAPGLTGQIRVGRSADAGCPDRASSCVRASAQLAAGGPASRGIVLELGAAHLAQASAPLGRFVILHELGDAVDAAMLDQDARDDLELVFRRAGWRPVCAQPGDPIACPAAHEVFADEFARWAHQQPLDDLFGAWPA